MHRRMKTAIFLILLSFSLPGCLITEWEDVSSEPEFSGLIGVVLISNEPLRAHGVTMEPNYEKILDHYSITPLPGFGGPEVLSAIILPQGTKFQITRALRCIDCFFKQEDLVLKIIEGPKLEGAPSKFDYDVYMKSRNKIFTIKNT